MMQKSLQLENENRRLRQDELGSKMLPIHHLTLTGKMLPIHHLTLTGQ